MKTLVQQTIVLVAASVSLNFMHPNQAFAMGRSLPGQNNPNAPKATNPPPLATTTTIAPPQTSLPPTTTLPSTGNINSEFRTIANIAGPIVDQKYSAYKELTPQRGDVSTHFTDKCDSNLTNAQSFAERITFAVETRFKNEKAQLGYVASYFGLNSDIKTYQANSLISHSLCYHTTSSIDFTLAGKRTPGANTVSKINEFSRRMNQYRQEAFNGSHSGYQNAMKLWSKLFMCLSYTESLTSADTTKSNSVSNKYAPADFRRPAGVLFYEDPYQTPESRLNIGLFQFTPSAGGNVQSCLRGWNDFFPSCKVDPKANQAEMIRIMGSGFQTFNGFCGVSKVTDMFSVQINTKTSNSTHPDNVLPGGTLKAPADRCVTPHFGSKSYNHFGPLQNGMGNTLDPLLSCALND